MPDRVCSHCPRPTCPRIFRLAGATFLAALILTGRASPPAGPSLQEFPLAQVSALLRPAVTVRLTAPLSGRFHLSADATTVAAGSVIGRFDTADLQAQTDTARLRLAIARQQDSDFISSQPARLQEAKQRIADLQSKLALARAITKDPTLLPELPAATQSLLNQADPAALEAELAAAQAKAAHLARPDFADTSTTRLQVRDAELSLRAAEEKLRAAIVTTPISGRFQPAPDLPATSGDIVLVAGQPIGTVRDVTHLQALVPALSPYLIQTDPAQTRLQLTGPRQQTFTATYSTAITAASPTTGEGRFFVYTFDPKEAPALAELVNTNLNAQILLQCAPAVTAVSKYQAALDHPGAFHDGWAAGVAKVWPGWRLACEGESQLGLVPAQP